MLADSQGRGLIIWPIAQRLFQSVMLQQRPRWTGGRRIPVGDQRNAGTRPALPWDDGDRPPVIGYGRYDQPPNASKTIYRNFALCALGVQPINLSNIARPQAGQLGGQPAVVHAIKPLPASVFKITGITKDSAGSPLASCRVNLFRVEPDRVNANNITYTFIAWTTSDGSGNYSFTVNRASLYQVVSINSGGTVVGATLNTLIGS